MSVFRCTANTCPATANDARGFCHVLVNWGVESTYLVIVTKPFERVIHGHYLLDLADEYGLEKTE